MFDCFISYKVGPDDALAHDFSQFLKNDDFSVFLDKKALLPGTNWSDELQKSMKNSNHVLAFFTADYVARIEQGNVDGNNFIIEELNWALKDQKLIPIAVGMPVNVIEEKCHQWIDKLKGLQFITFENKSTVHYQTILNQLNKLIRKRSQHNNVAQLSSAQSKQHDFSSHDAYLKLMMPWKPDEATNYKETLEAKFLKEPIDYVVLAAFYLKGRFGIKIEPEIAYQHLKKAASNHCPEAFYELGVLYEFEDNKYGGDEDKATEYYTKGHQLGDIRASYRLALLFDENIENNNCPTQFLKNKYGIENENQFIENIFLKKDSYSTLNTTEKYSYCLAQIHADESKAQAIEEMHILASSGYLRAVAWLGYEYSKNDSEVVQNTQKSLTYLHAGEEQDDAWCRTYLACIYLETEYRELGFDENIPLGLKKHQQNIQLNYFDSAYDLAWVLDNKPELQKHISINEQILFLEKAVDFGQLNCREFLCKCYIKTKHPSLSAFAIKCAASGYFKPIEDLLVAVVYSSSFKGIIKQADYQIIYNLYQKKLKNASGKRALNLTLLLTNWAMDYNRLQDALNLVDLSNEESKYYYYAKQVALKGYSNAQQLTLELLKKGATRVHEYKIGDSDELFRKVKCHEEESAKWLLLILVGSTNPSYKPFFESSDFDDSFMDEFLQGINNGQFYYDSDEKEFEYVNDGKQLKYRTLNNKDFSSAASEISHRRHCEQSLLLSTAPNQGLLTAYAKIKYSTTFAWLPKSIYNDSFDLGIACYKKLFSEAKNKNEIIPQTALYMHLYRMFKSANIMNNEKHIKYCLQSITHQYISTEEGSIGKLIENFDDLYSAFFDFNNNQEMSSFHEFSELIYATFVGYAFAFFSYMDSSEASFILPEIPNIISSLSSDEFKGDTVIRDRLLFDCGCIWIASYPYLSLTPNESMYEFSFHLLVYHLYSENEDFKFNQITAMTAVPNIIKEKILSAANDGHQQAKRIIKSSAFRHFAAENK